MILGCSWGLMESSWGLLKRSWDLLGASWEALIPLDYPGAPSDSVNVSNTLYVEDVAHTKIILNPTHCQEVDKQTDQIFKESIAPLSPHNMKNQLMIKYMGPGSQDYTKKTLKSPIKDTIYRQARYLGPYLTADHTTATERQKRFTAATKSWHLMGWFWHSRTNLKFRLIVFWAMVQSILLSGLVSFALIHTDNQALNEFILRKGRLLLRSRATKKTLQEDGSTKYQSLPNQQIRKILQIAPAMVPKLCQRNHKPRTIHRIPNWKTPNGKPRRSPRQPLVPPSQSRPPSNLPRA